MTWPAVYEKSLGRMLSDETWDTLEHSKDFVLNSLDLISFILVTPVLLRSIRPAFLPMANMLVSAVRLLGFFFTVCGLGLFLILISHGRWSPESGWSPDSMGWALFTFLLFVVVLAGSAWFVSRIAEGTNKFQPHLAEWIGKHAFALGIVTFFASRLFAVSLAAHQLFGWPK